LRKRIRKAGKKLKIFLIETRSLPALARRCHRDFAFYVAYPVSSILPSYFLFSVVFFHTTSSLFVSRQLPLGSTATLAA
jgi:hypothetical protein